MEPTCRYCGAAILPTLRGRRPEARATCGTRDCQRQHQIALATAWRAANADRQRTASTAWKEAHPEQVAHTRRTWREANREEQYELNRLWRRAHPDRQRQMVKDWERRNPAARAGYAVQRRTRKQAGYVAERDWARLCRRYGGRCAYCSELAPLTQDHVIPLARGGRHTIGNLLPACLRCNCSKQDRLLVEWRTGRASTRSPRAVAAT